MSEEKEYPFKSLNFTRMAPEEQLENSEAFLAMLRRRKTVRQFSTEPVPFELIANAILAAGTAPSGANLQPWTFVIIEDMKIKQQIRQAAEEEEKEFYASKITPEWREALAPLGTDWVKTHLVDAPYLLVVFEQTYRLDEAGEVIQNYYVRESVGIAVGFLLASLTSAGLVTLTHTPSPMGFLGKLLKRPANERPFVVIPVGFPAEDARVPDISKKPLGQIMVRF